MQQTYHVLKLKDKASSPYSREVCIRKASLINSTDIQMSSAMEDCPFHPQQGLSQDPICRELNQANHYTRAAKSHINACLDAKSVLANFQPFADSSNENSTIEMRVTPSCILQGKGLAA